MATGKVHHWKHGWIPITPDAKAYKEGRGPKPGVAPNVAKGLPQRSVKDESARAQESSRRIANVVPAVGLIPPHYTQPSQDRPGYYDGGLEMNTFQTHNLLDWLKHNEEGTESNLDIQAASGEPPRLSRDPRVRSKELGKELRQLTGLDISPLPAYTNDHPPKYTGGIQLLAPDAEALADWLEARRTGTTSRREIERAEGMR